MKNLLVLFLIVIGISSKAQIDLSADASFLGIYPTVKFSYPIDDIFIVGGSFGYNTTNYYLTEKFDAVFGIKFDNWIQLELDLGVFSGYDRGARENGLDKRYLFHADFGAKMHFANNMFCSVQVAYPGFIKFGLGVRFRPYKKLTVWDKQG
jgi:hypothetical protein